MNNEDLFCLTIDRHMDIQEYHRIYFSDLEIDYDHENLYPYPPNVTSLLDCNYLT